MINCPDCDKPMHTRKCSCGYFMRGAAPATQAYTDIKNASDHDHLLASKRWLIEQGIVKPGMSTTERMKACADYRKSLKHTERPAGLEWAQEIIRKAEDEPVPQVAVAMALAALKRGGLAVEDTDETP